MYRKREERHVDARDKENKTLLAENSCNINWFVYVDTTGPIDGL